MNRYINNTLIAQEKKFSLIWKTLLVLVTLIMTSLLPSQSYAYIGQGCSDGSGSGTCQNRSTTSCPTYYNSGNFCPNDPNNVQCCVSNPNPRHCSTYTSSQCHNSSSGGYGNTYNCGAVGGTFNSGGYCPGPNDVQCCVVPVQPPPTSVTASCPGAGTTATVNWTLPSGYSWAYARFYDETTGATFYPAQMTGSSYSISSTPGHRYSYWVHTTNSIGEPWSADTPTAHTASVTCLAPTNTPTPTPTPGPCPNNPAPVGTIVSTGVAASASNIKNNDAATYGPLNANDGVISPTKYWDSGGFATQWLEFNLGAPQQVSGIQLTVHTGTASLTGHSDQIKVGTTSNPSTVATSFSCSLVDGQVINFPLSLTNVQYLRVNTSSSGPAVGWYEVSVFGSSPGSQSNTPGLIFSGGGTTDFGAGNPSTTNWLAGGITYPETFSTNAHQSTTAYSYLLNKATHAGIPITNLANVSGCSNLANCTLPAGLAHGVYKADSAVTLNTYTFPLNNNYVFLINGDLRIAGNIVVPNGSTAFFSSSRDINIDKAVGTAVNLFPLPAGQLQGFYSADRDFNIEGINDCLIGPDKMLNVEGAIITNAGGQGGKFRTKRDLCGDNPNDPSLTVRLRLDMILNLPVLLMRQKTTYREDAP